MVILSINFKATQSGFANNMESGGTQMKAKEYYNVAIYLRLSRDDGDMDGDKMESNSISSQRDMIRSNPDMISPKYREAFEELKRGMRKRQDKRDKDE